jgi:hypothetical protein
MAGERGNGIPEGCEPAAYLAQYGVRRDQVLGVLEGHTPTQAVEQLSYLRFVETGDASPSGAAETAFALVDLAANCQACDRGDTCVLGSMVLRAVSGEEGNTP